MMSPVIMLLTASPSVVMLASESPNAALLSAIAQMRRSPSLQARDRVLSAVRELEASQAAPAASSAEGRWALIYSTQEAGTATSVGGGIAQALVDTTYAAFFKVAPILAGAQEAADRNGASNEQRLDLAAGRVFNTVRTPLPFLSPSAKVTITVDGSVSVAGEQSTASPSAEAPLSVVFEVRSTLNGVSQLAARECSAISARRHPRPHHPPLRPLPRTIL